MGQLEVSNSAALPIGKASDKGSKGTCIKLIKFITLMIPLMRRPPVHELIILIHYYWTRPERIVHVVAAVRPEKMLLGLLTTSKATARSEQLNWRCICRSRLFVRYQCFGKFFSTTRTQKLAQRRLQDL